MYFKNSFFFLNFLHTNSLIFFISCSSITIIIVIIAIILAISHSFICTLLWWMLVMVVHIVWRQSNVYSTGQQWENYYSRWCFLWFASNLRWIEFGRSEIRIWSFLKTLRLRKWDPEAQANWLCIAKGWEAIIKHIMLIAFPLICAIHPIIKDPWKSTSCPF